MFLEWRHGLVFINAFFMEMIWTATERHSNRILTLHGGLFGGCYTPNTTDGMKYLPQSCPDLKLLVNQFLSRVQTDFSYGAEMFGRRLKFVNTFLSAFELADYGVVHLVVLSEMLGNG
jgi:hypothetical protein